MNANEVLKQYAAGKKIFRQADLNSSQPRTQFKMTLFAI